MKKLRMFVDEYFRGHSWVVRTGEMFGVATHYRYCETCPVEETYMFDFTKQDMVWVKGNFLKRQEHMYIIAATRYAYQQKIIQVQASDPSEYEFRWLEHSSDVRQMCRRWRWPLIRFASDWHESDILQMSELAKVLQTGHT